MVEILVVYIYTCYWYFTDWPALLTSSASAYSAGYPAAYVCDENIRDSSPYIHSASDTVSTVNFPHVLEHAKVRIYIKKPVQNGPMI
jgi:leucyl aminopeptidase